MIADHDHRVVSLGYNGFPRGVVDDPARYNDRAEKYRFTSHAERNAIDNARASLVDCTLYATHFPCVECAKSIIQQGIARVITYPAGPDYLVRWQGDIALACLMFDEAGVLYTKVNTNG